MKPARVRHPNRVTWAIDGFIAENGCRLAERIMARKTAREAGTR